jgi:hypothetical protein
MPPCDRSLGAPGATVGVRGLCWWIPTRARQLAWWCVFVLGGVLLFVAYVRVSRTQATNSDGASNALQAWDMLHGNLLLHGWWLSDVSFYTTELPQYMVAEAVHGLNADVVHVAAAMAYTLLVLLSALLARGEATGRQAAMRMALAAGIVLAPQLGTGTYVLLLSPDHVGTSVLMLGTWLVLDRAGRRWWVPVTVAALLALGLVADTLVLFIGVAPLVLVCGAYVCKKLVARRRPGINARGANPSGANPSRVDASFELALMASAAASVPVALLVAAAIRAAGGYHVGPVHVDLVPLAQLPHNTLLTFDGITLLYGAYFAGLKPGFAMALAFLHLVGVLLGGWALWAGARRFSREASLVTDALVAAAVINLALYLASTRVTDLRSTRDIAAVLPFGAVLVGRLLADRLVKARLAPLLAAVLLGYLLSLAYAAAQSPLPAANTPLTTWLARHHLNYGLGGYWDASSVSVASRGQIQVRPVCAGARRPRAYRWESRASWYDPALHWADFLVMRRQPSTCPGPSYRQVRTAFGKPAAFYRVGRYTILVWHTNLLAQLEPTRMHAG